MFCSIEIGLLGLVWIWCAILSRNLAANLCGRRFAGLEQDEEFCKLSKARREEIENLEDYDNMINHIEDLHIFRNYFMVKEDANVYAQIPF